jgi:hypothetical protein
MSEERDVSKKEKQEQAVVMPFHLMASNVRRERESDEAV